MFTLNPGATFRRLVTFFEAGRSGPRLDLTDVVFSVRNLDPAPWVIQILPADLVNGQIQLYIPAADTQLALSYNKYPFQLRLVYPTGDVQFLPTLVINTGPRYLAGDPAWEPDIEALAEPPAYHYAESLNLHPVPAVRGTQLAENPPSGRELGA